MTRHRYCNNPVPENGGDKCEGADVETASCGEGACPSEYRFGFLISIHNDSGLRLCLAAIYILNRSFTPGHAFTSSSARLAIPEVVDRPC